MIFVRPPEKKKSALACGVAFSGVNALAVTLKKDEEGMIEFVHSAAERCADFTLSKDWATGFAVERALGAIRRVSKHVPTFAAYPEEYSFRVLGFTPSTGAGLEEGVHAEVLKHAPLSESDVLYDYTPLVQTSEGVSFIAPALSAPHAKILCAPFEKSKLDLVALDLESEALSAALIAPRSHAAYVLLHIEEDKTVLALVHNNVVLSSRSVGFGSSIIRNAMKETFDVSDEDIRFVLESGQLALVPDSELYTIFTTGVRLVTDEIKEMTIEYGSFDGAHPIAGVLMSGSGAYLARDFTDFFALGLRLPVKHADVWKNITIKGDSLPPIPFKQSLEYAVPIGMALLGLKK